MSGKPLFSRSNAWAWLWAISPFVVIALVFVCVGPFERGLDFVVDTLLAFLGAFYPAILVWAMLQTPGALKLRRWLVAAMVGVGLTLLMFWNLVALYAPLGLVAVPLVPGWALSAR